MFAQAFWNQENNHFQIEQLWKARRIALMMWSSSERHLHSVATAECTCNMSVVHLSKHLSHSAFQDSLWGAFGFRKVRMVAEPSDPDSKVSGEGSKVDRTQSTSCWTCSKGSGASHFPLCLTAAISACDLLDGLHFSLNWVDVWDIFHCIWTWIDYWTAGSNELLGILV